MRFRAFGIPVTIDPFFLIGLVMIWSWAGGERAGLFAALFVGVFTLVHELGHALTARRFGATTAITLNLLVGWASYATPRPLTRRQRNLISLAGPLTQIAAALPVLWLTHAALPDIRTDDGLQAVLDGSLAYDLWVGAIWAGIVIGLLNLLPLWPLDGGHVVDSFLGRLLGEHRGRRVMLIGTLVLVGVVFALGLAAQNPEPPYNGLERQVVDAKVAPIAGLQGEGFMRSVWEQVRTFPGNVLDFPFLLLIFCGLNSFLALQRVGRQTRVDQVRVDQVRVDQVRVDQVRVDQVRVDQGRVDQVRGVMDVRLAPLARLRAFAADGTAEQIAHEGVAAYRASADPEALYLTAAGLARTGHLDDAMGWLRRAVQDRPDAQRLVRDPALEPLRSHPAFAVLVDEARRGG